MIYLVLYDIEKDSPRTRLAKQLEHHGLLRLQYSVFAGFVHRQRAKKLKGYLKKFKERHCQPDDKIYILPLRAENFKKIETLGPELDMDYLLNEQHTLYI